MTDQEKAKKYDKLRDWLWGAAMGGNMLQSTLAAALIRQHEIEGPNGEEPDYA